MKDVLLRVAARSGDAAQVRALLAAGANTRATGNEKRSALWHACEAGCEEAALALLPSSDVNAAGHDYGESILMVAVRKKFSAETIRALVAAGANGAAVNVEGWTALHFAALIGGPGILEALLPICDTEARDSLGRTPEDFAKIQGVDSALAVFARERARRERDALLADIPGTLADAAAGDCGASAPSRKPLAL
jgi:ankyrin repeat protein